ncbi:MAG TPA: hypothetical protein VH814_03495 [Steroidobacteraceae bacterium]
MKPRNDHPQQLPVHDYGTALQSAVSWLGDRYLLAAPIEARRPDRYADAGFAVARRRYLRSAR